MVAQEYLIGKTNPWLTQCLECLLHCVTQLLFQSWSLPAFLLKNKQTNKNIHIHKPKPKNKNETKPNETKLKLNQSKDFWPFLCPVKGGRKAWVIPRREAAAETNTKLIYFQSGQDSIDSLLPILPVHSLGDGKDVLNKERTSLLNSNFHST